MSAEARSAAAARSPSRLSTWTKILAFAPLVVGAACAEPEARPRDELVLQGDVYLDPETLQPFTGTIFSTFDDQPLVIAERLSLRDGAYEGPYEAYFANRKLSAKEYYHDGHKHGPYEWYFDSGRLFEKGTYDEGMLDGPYEAFWESGELYEEGTYREGEFDGPRRWYLNGSLIELVTYVNGVIDGPYERYREDGTIDLRGMLRQGEPCGTWLEGPATITYPGCGVSTD